MSVAKSQPPLFVRKRGGFLSCWSLKNTRQTEGKGRNNTEKREKKDVASRDSKPYPSVMFDKLADYASDFAAAVSGVAGVTYVNITEGAASVASQIAMITVDLAGNAATFIIDTSGKIAHYVKKTAASAASFPECLPELETSQMETPLIKIPPFEPQNLPAVPDLPLPEEGVRPEHGQVSPSFGGTGTAGAEKSAWKGSRGGFGEGGVDTGKKWGGAESNRVIRCIHYSNYYSDYYSGISWQNPPVNPNFLTRVHPRTHPTNPPTTLPENGEGAGYAGGYPPYPLAFPVLPPSNATHAGRHILDIQRTIELIYYFRRELNLNHDTFPGHNRAYLYCFEWEYALFDTWTCLKNNDITEVWMSDPSGMEESKVYGIEIAIYGVKTDTGIIPFYPLPEEEKPVAMPITPIIGTEMALGFGVLDEIWGGALVKRIRRKRGGKSAWRQ